MDVERDVLVILDDRPQMDPRFWLVGEDSSYQCFGSSSQELQPLGRCMRWHAGGKPLDAACLVEHHENRSAQANRRGRCNRDTPSNLHPGR